MDYASYPTKKLAGTAKIVKVNGEAYLLEKPVGKEPFFTRMPDNQWLNAEKQRQQIEKQAANAKIDAINEIKDDVTTAPEVG